MIEPTEQDRAAAREWSWNRMGCIHEDLAESLATLKRANTTEMDLRVDAALLVGGSGYDILNG